MTDQTSFTLALLLVAVGLLVAVLASRLSARLRVATPAVLLIAAAAVANLVPGWEGLSGAAEERIVSVALVLILFDGGMHIGWRRFRQALGASTWIAVAGTLVTAGGIAVVMHWLFGFGWLESVLLGAALSPTDPAVVFSVFGGREVAGRSGTILEAESGLNDPVGISLLVALLAASGSGLDIAVGAAGGFGLQMVIGAAVGVVGGLALRRVMQRLVLPGEALHMLLVVAAALVLYAAGTAAQGSGFLAVFVAGILVGDVRAPFKREVDAFTGGLANLGEIVAFVLLGLTIDAPRIVASGALLPGLVLAVLLVLVLRPLLVGAVLLPIALRRGERWFVLLAGLKGAVPILLGLLVLESGRPGADRLFDVIVVVVLVSVLVQASLVPWLADRLRVPMSAAPLRPYVAGLRFEQEPEEARRLLVEAGSPADGTALTDLPLSADGWLSMVRRRGAIVPLLPGTRLEAGDEVLAFTGDGELARSFRRSG